ncbi:MAG: hypothetical protein ACYCYN_12985, partial [Solirubrobacteraceae bacterium]
GAPLDGARFTALAALDDAAYGFGVWRGCLRERCVSPLLPALRRGRRAARAHASTTLRFRSREALD